MKLTVEEKRWIKALQDILAVCPSKRLGFYTIGDPDVMIYDRTKEDKINDLMDAPRSRLDFPMAVQQAKADTEYTLEFPNHVHSVAG